MDGLDPTELTSAGPVVDPVSADALGLGGGLGFGLVTLGPHFETGVPELLSHNTALLDSNSKRLAGKSLSKINH